MYSDEQKRVKLQELAKKSVATFNGVTLEFVTIKDTEKLTLLKAEQANEFLIALFSTQDKRGFITLGDGSIVMYNILEQKMLAITNNDINNPIVRLKSAMFNEGLIKKLQNKYKTEIFIQGL
jgi:peptidyl-prolyl cis-trans isomerase D